MNSNDEFARELFEDSKVSLSRAISESDQIAQQRHLRHALLSGFSFLELQIDLIAQHFTDNKFFTLHERGIINQREIVFEKGAFRMKSGQKFSRLGDRMLLFQHKFKGSKLSERAWWNALSNATDRRNSVAHPREVVFLEASDVAEDLQAIISCANDLFAIVFGKGLPYASLGIKPKLA